MWAEKYRPKTLDDIVGQELVVRYFKNIQNNSGQINHCIFHGDAGTGKTTTANILSNTLGCDLLPFNASDDRTLNFIRNTIIPAMKYIAFNGNYKIIFMDECENLVKDAWECLRSPMEKMSKNARIIFSCNDKSNIIEPVVSRCTVFQFMPIEKEGMIRRLKYIASQENMSVSENEYKYLLQKAHGDMRKGINLLEQLKHGGLEITDFDLLSL